MLLLVSRSRASAILRRERKNSFDARATLEVSGREYEIHRLDSLQSKFDVARLPYSLKVLLENALRLEDGQSVSADDVEAIASWDAKAEPSVEIPFQPARVLMQDFTGVPAVVDLAAMRDAMEDLGGDPAAINPLVDVDLVIDHSVQVDAFGNQKAFAINEERDYERNGERYAFLRWGQEAFDNFRVVPPATGICHQVNLEYLGKCVWTPRDGRGHARPIPDTLVGTDSHTTMINGLGVLGWGVGGIEAEAAMLGQPISMLLPQVIGFKLDGELPEGVDRHRPGPDRDRDAAREGRRRQVRRVLRPRPRSGLPLADRATIGNMSPEFGSTCAIFPIDAETLRYLEFTGPPDRADRAGRRLHARAGPLPRARTPRTRPTPTRSSSTSATSCPASPGRSAPRTGSRWPTPSPPSSRRCRSGTPRPASSSGSPLDEAHRRVLPRLRSRRPRTTTTTRGKPRRRRAGRGGDRAHPTTGDAIAVQLESGETVELDHGHVVIAAITSCTNTSNPSVMLGAGPGREEGGRARAASASPG